MLKFLKGICIYFFLLVLTNLPCFGQDRQFKYDSTRLEIHVDSLLVMGDSRNLKFYWRATNNYGKRIRLDYDLMPSAFDIINKQLLLPQTKLNRKITETEMQKIRELGCGVWIRQTYMSPDTTISLLTEYYEQPNVENGHEMPLNIRGIKSLDVYFDDGRKFKVIATHR